MIDAHTHLESNRFGSEAVKIIKNFERDGVDLAINVGSDLATSKASVALSRDHERIYAVVGVHPHEASTYTDEVEDALRVLSSYDKVVALGEMGLDYHYDFSPRKVQREVFEKQLELAMELKLPVVIHSREAEADTLEILSRAHKRAPELKVLLHCYMDSVATMKKYVDMGFLISLGGAVTFKNAKNPKEVARAIPVEHLLLETDAPYMTPVPHRGKRNEPKYVALVADYIAQLRGMEVEELVKITDDNALNFYGISMPRGMHHD
ncbi:MAG: TatD family hydrolase [Tissierellia bacterium]|nr:TatD family hydrolase [Tissierellia bacterium]